MDLGEERRQLYGKAGACRIKSYGPEYRTLSNFWIFEDHLIEWVWRNTERTLANMAMDFEEFGDDIQKCINTNDKVLAEHLVQVFNLEVV